MSSVSWPISVQLPRQIAQRWPSGHDPPAGFHPVRSSQRRSMSRDDGAAAAGHSAGRRCSPLCISIRRSPPLAVRRPGQLGRIGPFAHRARFDVVSTAVAWRALSSYFALLGGVVPESSIASGGQKAVAVVLVEIT